MILLLLLAAFFVGAYEGTLTAATGPAADYRQQTAARRARQDKAGAAAGLGFGATTAAVGVATGRSLWTITRGFTRGFRAGWKKGWTWTEKKFDRSPDAAPATAVSLVKEPKPAAVPAPVPAPAAAAAPPAPAVTAPVPTPTPLTPRHLTSVPAPTTGGTPAMPLTTTAGEAANYTALLTALDAVVTESAANVDDAQADLKRSELEVTNIEALVASLAAVGLDNESLGHINALIEPFQQRAAAAKTRLAASEHAGSQAIQARDLVVRKHGLMKEAHDATPEAANKPFYAGG